MDTDRLVDALARFGGTDSERRAVARQARDIADAGIFAADEGYTLDTETVLGHLEDAPDGGPADRWNWWLGSLDALHGGYAAFQVRRWRE